MVHEQLRRAAEQGEFPARAISHLQALLSDSEARGFPVSARRSLLGTFEVQSLSSFEGEHCPTEAQEWLLTARQLLHWIDQELARPGRRDLSQTDAYQARLDWEKRFKKLESELASAESRLKKLQSLASRSAGLEVSELLATREGLRRSLFGSKDDVRFFFLHKASPAEGWLKYKWKQAERALTGFKRLLPQLRRSWLGRPTSESELARPNHDYACSSMENASLTWRLALKHVESGQFFCDTFSQTINPASHPYVAHYCLGKFSRKGERKKEALLQERREEILEFKAEAEAIETWMDREKCPQHEVGASR